MGKVGQLGGGRGEEWEGGLEIIFTQEFRERIGRTSGDGIVLGPGGRILGGWAGMDSSDMRMWILLLYAVGAGYRAIVAILCGMNILV